MQVSKFASVRLSTVSQLLRHYLARHFLHYLRLLSVVRYCTYLFHCSRVSTHENILRTSRINRINTTQNIPASFSRTRSNSPSCFCFPVHQSCLCFLCTISCVPLRTHVLYNYRRTLSIVPHLSHLLLNYRAKSAQASLSVLSSVLDSCTMR